ncbi:MAG: outer membrane protein assembly factor BamD [Bdellovibrionales bacterium]|nr:outer membrane protein assembly factor BamD [Bdellovibrionales bacterium]
MNRPLFELLHKGSGSTLTLLLLSSLSFVFFGCSGSNNEPEDAPKEIPLSETPAMKGTEDDLFTTAKKLYSNGYYLVSQDAFRSVAESFPLGPYGEFSEIKVADALFIQNDFAEAAALYERILKNYPGSHSSPYVRMRAGRSHQLVNTDLGRDREPLEKALEHYQTFLQEFPHSMFRTQVKEYLKVAQEKVAEHENMVAEFYRKQGYEGAYEKRRRRYYQTLARFGLPNDSTADSISDNPLAAPVVIAAQEKDIHQPSVVRLGRASYSGQPVEDLLDEDLTDAAKKSARQKDLAVTSQTRSIPFLETSPQVVSARAISEKNPRDSKNFQSAFGRSIVRDIRCSTRAGDKLTIELKDPLQPPVSFSKIKPVDGMISYDLPLQLEQAISMSCFEAGDLLVSKTGNLQLKSKWSYSILELQNPPRVVLARVGSS